MDSIDQVNDILPLKSSALKHGWRARRCYVSMHWNGSHDKLCNIYSVYCLNYILNDWEVKLKTTHFLTRLLQHNTLFYKRIWNISCFQTHHQFSKFTIQDMPFKTKLTPLVNTRELTDNASLKMIRILAVTLGTTTELKKFGRCII